MKRILVLEDNAALAAHWKTLLENRGYQVVHETDCDSAIRTVQEIAFDLVIADIFLQNEASGQRRAGGIALLGFISINISPPPILIVVSGATPAINIEGQVSNFQPYATLLKPVGDELLLTTVAAGFRDSDARKKP